MKISFFVSNRVFDKFKLCTFLFFVASAEAIGQEKLPINEGSTLYDTLAILVALACLVGFIYVFMKLKTYARRFNVEDQIKDAESTSIQDFIDGDSGKIIGKVIPLDNPLIAPLTNKKCVYYYATIKQNAQGEHGPTLKVIADEKKSCEFLVADDTGLAKFYFEGAKLFIKDGITVKTGMFNNTKGNTNSFLNKHGISTGFFSRFGRKYTVSENVVVIGKGVAISGQGKWDATTDPIEKRTNPNTLIFRHSEEAPLHLSDDV